MIKQNIKVIDLYCGLGGWTTGLIENNIDVTGYDIVDFSDKYPSKFVKADLLTYNNFDNCDIIVASPPCTDFTKSSFPKTWRVVKDYPPDIPSAMKLFNRVYEIVDIVKPVYYLIENVRGAQKYVGKAKFHIGSRYFWGTFPNFTVTNKEDIYGKSYVAPSKDRPAIRAKIPLSISRAFAKTIIERFKQYETGD